MRIAFSGAHSTGKSTLAEWLSAELGLPYVRETARQVFERMGIGSADLSLLPTERRMEAQGAIIRDHIEATCAEAFVSDRAEADVLAYSLYWLDRDGWPKWLEAMRVMAKHGAERYDLVFLVPPFGTLAADGLRVEAPDHQWTIHYLIAGILRECGYPVRELRSCGINERKEEVLRHLGKA